MTWELLSVRNQSAGLQVPLIYINDITEGLFMNLFIFAVFIVIALGTYFAQKRRTGEGDMPASFAVAGYITTGFTILLSLITGLIPPLTLGVVIVIAALCVLWLYFSREN